MEPLAHEDRVLVIGTNEKARKQIRKALSDARLEFATDWKKAIVSAKSFEPVVILMDLGLPCEDGFNLMKRLRLNKATSDIPIVMFTVNVSEVGEYANDPLATRMVFAKEDFCLLAGRVRELAAEYEVLKSIREALPYLRYEVTDAASGFTEEEEKELTSGGFPLRGEREMEPIARRARVYGSMLATSLTAEQAAKRLRVSPSRVRQRLLARPPRLYGIRRGSKWHLPGFQFGTHDLVPGIDKVIERIDPELNPVAVYQWFHQPNVDLEQDGSFLSPLEWLNQGLDLRPVTKLAEDL